MSHRIIYQDGGDTEFTNQFGTVRRMLNAAMEGKTDKGEVTHFAEVQTESGERVLVNPHDVSRVVENKGN